MLSKEEAKAQLELLSNQLSAQHELIETLRAARIAAEDEAREAQYAADRVLQELRKIKREVIENCPHEFACMDKVEGRERILGIVIQCTICGTSGNILYKS